MSLRSAGRRMSRKFNRLLTQGALNSGIIQLKWREALNVPDSADPHLQVSKTGAEWPERDEEVAAFIHYVNIHRTAYTRHSQVKEGDVILDFPGAVDIDGRKGLEFHIGGKIYVQKDGGDELAASWDVRSGGLAITRTVLVTLKS